MRHRGASRRMLHKDTWAKLHKLQAHTAAHAIAYSIHVVSTASSGHSMTL